MKHMLPGGERARWWPFPETYFKISRLYYWQGYFDAIAEYSDDFISFHLSIISPWLLVLPQINIADDEFRAMTRNGHVAHREKKPT